MDTVFVSYPLPLSFPSLSIDLIYWPGLTRRQNLRCYQKTIFLVEVLKVTRYDWQKSHFSPGQSVQEAEGGGQKFVPAVKRFMSFKYLTSLGEKCLGRSFDLKMCKIIAFCSDFRGKYSRFDYQLMIIGNWSQVWCRLWIIILLHLWGSPPVRDH